MENNVAYNEGYITYPKEDVCPYDEAISKSSWIAWWNGWDDAERKAIPSALERIENAHIFSVNRNEYGFVLEECCDNHYRKFVTKEDLLQLSQELIHLANS